MHTGMYGWGTSPHPIVLVRCGRIQSFRLLGPAAISLPD
jgi:hypothetical protein